MRINFNQHKMKKPCTHTKTAQKFPIGENAAERPFKPQSQIESKFEKLFALNNLHTKSCNKLAQP